MNSSEVSEALIFFQLNFAKPAFELIKCFLCQLCMQLTEYAPTTMVYIRSIAEGVNKKSFCGSESQGFVTPYSRQECHSDLAELTIQEHTTYRAYGKTCSNFSDMISSAQMNFEQEAQWLCDIFWLLERYVKSLPEILD